jgi:hypothetical protein
MLLTPEQMAAKLAALNADEIPALEEAMNKACLNIEALSKDYCTPGKSPYYKAPYSDDNDPRRQPPHMRDTIEGRVKETTPSSVTGEVGTPKEYALAVHEGTKRMRARAFILDAINEKKEETLAILGDATVAVIRRQCV